MRKTEMVHFIVINYENLETKYFISNKKYINFTT